MGKDYYKILGVEKNADDNELKKGGFRSRRTCSRRWFGLPRLRSPARPGHAASGCLINARNEFACIMLRCNPPWACQRHMHEAGLATARSSFRTGHLLLLLTRGLHNSPLAPHSVPQTSHEVAPGEQGAAGAAGAAAAAALAHEAPAPLSLHSPNPGSATSRASPLHRRTVAAAWQESRIGKKQPAHFRSRGR